ncbi:MAG: type II toxin-antitoxin system RelE/ParE family toxin [Gammaproteobacteria bacterium]
MQSGREPTDWKPMRRIGAGVREIPLHQGGEHRLIYVARFEEAIYMLHAFEPHARGRAATPRSRTDGSNEPFRLLPAGPSAHRHRLERFGADRC